MSELLDVLRTEQKYRLDYMEMMKMSGLLQQVFHQDAHSGLDGYPVRSLYFDTPDDSDFYDKLDGYEVRRKIRLRIYSPDAEWAKLELKEKQGSLQRKRSLKMNREQAMAVSRGEYEVLLERGTDFSKELYGRMKQFHYQPKCLVEYDRKAFVVEENDTRITLDSNLRATGGCLELFAKKVAWCPLDMDGTGTMEVKFNRFLLSYVKQIVSLPSYMQTSASKYVAARNYILGIDV